MLKQILNEGAKEVAVEDFIKNLIHGTEWENKVFIAGGYVRDFVMGKDPKDLDIMVDAPNGGFEFAKWITKKIGNYKGPSVDPPWPPKPRYNVDDKGKPATKEDQAILDDWIEKLTNIQKLYTNPVIFPRFGTAKFNLRGITYQGQDLSTMDIEAVMPRSETYTAGSRKPEVGFSSLQGDAERRDLTVNALFKNISTGEILDLTGKGFDDLKKGIVRTPLEPSKTFTDDPLRMLRVVRFYAKYGWSIPKHIIKALKNNSQQLENISAERIQDELNKMLMTVNPDKAVKLLKITNLLQYIIPELKQAVKMTQNHHHKMDVFDHTLDVLKKTQPVLVQRLMGLFHDIGKVVTRSVTPTGVHFYGHEEAGAEMVETIMRRLKYPTEVINAVKIGVANHMRLKHGGDTAVNLSDKSLRKFTMEVGEHLENVLGLIHADNIAHSEESSMPNQIEFVKNRLKSLNTTLKKPDLPINGFDLQKELGLKPGPIFGEITKAITEAWLEDPKLSREKALDIAKKIANKTDNDEKPNLKETFQKLANIKIHV
jgi:poly(A) polymerase